MKDALIIDAIRTPIGRYGGALASVRADDLGAVPLRALMARHPSLDWRQVDDIFYGCANQAGEDNRNVARMSALLAGLPVEVPGTTFNRLCGSGLDAVGNAARAIKTGEAGLMIAGGVESMSRAPFVMGKAEQAFSRSAEIFDTTIGWRFVNRQMKAQFGIDSMPETAENVAEQFAISREDQDLFALRSQQRTAAAMEAGRLAAEIVPVEVARRKQAPLVVDTDEHPRAATTLEQLAGRPTPVREDGSVTAGTASGVNDGAGALLLASAEQAERFGHLLDGSIELVVGGNERLTGEGGEQLRVVHLEEGGPYLLGEAFAETLVGVAAQGPVVVGVGRCGPDHPDPIGIDPAILDGGFPHGVVDRTDVVGAGFDQRDGA